MNCLLSKKLTIRCFVFYSLIEIYELFEIGLHRRFLFIFKKLDDGKDSISGQENSSFFIMSLHPWRYIFSSPFFCGYLAETRGSEKKTNARAVGRSENPRGKQ